MGASQGFHVLLSISGGQGTKGHGKGIAVFPEVLPRDIRTISNVRTATIRQARLRERQEARVP